MPSRINFTESLLIPRLLIELKGVPLSVRIRSGTPYRIINESQIRSTSTWPRLLNRLAIKDEPAERIGDRERVTAISVAAFEAALEVHTPNLIGSGCWNVRHRATLPR